MTGALISAAEADALFAPLRRYRTLVLAVSGGADSTALMHLVAAWNSRRIDDSRTIVVATVDHGLRAAAATEAEAVAQQAAALGVAHRTLRWTEPKPITGIQAAAREARYRLLFGVAVGVGSRGVGEPVAIVTAHTADDQAETLLMRLARGSGIDGLAAISPVSTLRGLGTDGHIAAVDLCRPLLGVTRARLVATLEAGAIAYIEDPSNTDTRFERVRMREALAHLRTLGFTVDSLARTATRLQLSRAALEKTVDALEAYSVRSMSGLYDEIDWTRASEAPDDIAMRLLRRSLSRHGGAAAAAELTQVEEALRRLFRADEGPPSFTLGGCMIEITRRPAAPPRLRVYREPDRDGGLDRMVLQPGGWALWDRRFHVGLSSRHGGAVDVGPLGHDWASLVSAHPGLARFGLPAAVARGLPAFRRQAAILAVPTLAALARSAGDEVTAVALAGPCSSPQMASDTAFAGHDCIAVVIDSEHRGSINPDLLPPALDNG